MPTPTPGPTANWEIYKDKDFGFELKYPPNYELFAKAYELKFLSPISKCNPPLVFNTEKYGEMRELELLIMKEEEQLGELLKEGFDEEIQIGNKRAYARYFGAEMFIPIENYTVEVNPGKVLTIVFHPFTSDDLGRCSPHLNAQNALKTKNQILSTFRFD